MAGPHTTRGTDGATVDQQATVTLSAAHAALAASGIRSIIHNGLEDLPAPWEDAEPLTAAQLERHAADTQAIADLFVPAMRQLEAQDVIDYESAYNIAYREACERHPNIRRGDVVFDRAAPTTGDVTIEWTADGWERLGRYLTSTVWIDRNDREELDRRLPVARGIREQLKAQGGT